MSAYLGKAFNPQVPAQVRVPRVHVLERKDTASLQRGATSRQAGSASESHVSSSQRHLGASQCQGGLEVGARPAQPGAHGPQAFVSLLHPRACSDEAN